MIVWVGVIVEGSWEVYVWDVFWVLVLFLDEVVIYEFVLVCLLEDLLLCVILIGLEFFEFVVEGVDCDCLMCFFEILCFCKEC